MPGVMTRSRGEAGFTLVELLVVLTLLGVIGSIVTSGLVQSMRVTRESQTRIEAMAELQRGAERMGRELRAACPLTGADPSDVRLVVARDGTRFEHRFRLSGGAVTHRVVEDPDGTPTTVQPERVLVPAVDTTLTRFTYLDADGLVATAPGDVRSIRTVLVRTLPDQPRPLRVESGVTLRNGGLACD